MGKITLRRKHSVVPGKRVTSVVLNNFRSPIERDPDLEVIEVSRQEEREFYEWLTHQDNKCRLKRVMDEVAGGETRHGRFSDLENERPAVHRAVMRILIRVYACNSEKELV